MSMFGSSVIARIRLPNCNHGDRGRILIYSKCLQPKQSRTSRFSGFQCKALNYMPLKCLSVNWLHSARKCFMFRCNTTQATVTTKNESKQTKTYFQELMFTRKEQADRSILLCVSTKDDIPYAVAKCEQFGKITNAYSYSGAENNYFVLLEFSNEIATQDLFKNCQYQCKKNIFPVFSRIIKFEKKSKTSLPKMNIEIQDSKTESSQKIGCSLSEVIEDIYCNEKLTELDTRLRYFFCTLVKDSLSGIFPHCDVFPFGSSVNGIGRHGCDLDVVLKLSEKFQMNDDGEFIFYNKSSVGGKVMQQKVVHLIGDYFRTCLPGITNMRKVLHCRVPIVKMNYEVLKIDCDVSVNNMAGVLMSDVVHFCGEVNPRFRPLLYAVKKWAKESCITDSTPGAWITNFGLTNLLIYFFQKEQILPPLNDALVTIGEDDSPDFSVQYLKPLEEWQNFALQNKKSLAELLIGFFSFLAEYPFDKNILSLLSGKARPQQLSEVTLWVQFLFDEGLNITKNVSAYEFDDMCNKAGIAVKSLESKLNQKTHCIKDFPVLLGIPSNVEELKSKNYRHPEKVANVNAYFEGHNNSKHKATKHIRM